MTRARRWCFTLNNYDQYEYELIKEVECSYLIVGKEVGQEGTPHLQGFICFETRKTFNRVKSYIGVRCHLEKARGDARSNIAYCSKDGDFFEKGERPLDPSDGGARERARWQTVIRLAKDCNEDRIADEYPDIYLRYMSNIRKLVKENERRPDTLDRLDNLWIWGPTGTGKSRNARNEYPDYYEKELNKWWDGYNGQANVIIDDLDPDSCKYMAKKIKNWADHYPFIAECKGSSKTIRPERIIVTSNYEPEDCFSRVDLEAIKRRFKVINLT